MALPENEVVNLAAELIAVDTTNPGTYGGPGPERAAAGGSARPSNAVHAILVRGAWQAVSAGRRGIDKITCCGAGGVC